MSLKQIFYRNVVDRALCPTKIIDSLGHTPYIKSKMFNRVIKPHIVYPALGLATSYALTNEWKNLAIGIAAGHGLTAFYTLSARFEVGARGKELFLFSSPQFHTDRTQKQQHPLSPTLLANIIKKEKLSKDAFFSALKWSTIIVAFTADTEKQMRGVGFASVFMLDYGARFWQNKRALDGEWNVIEKAPPRETIQDKLPQLSSPTAVPV